MNRHKNYSQVQQTLMSTLTHGLIQKQNEGVRCMRYGYNSTNLNQFNGAGNCNGGNTVNNQNIGSINNRYQIFSRVVDNKNNCNTNKELQYGQKSTNLDPKMIKIGLNNSYQHTNPIGNRSLNSGNPRSNQKQKQKMLHRINSTITSFHQHNVLNKHNHKNNQ